MKNGNSATKFVMKSEKDKRYYREHEAEIYREQLYLRAGLRLSRYYKKYMDSWSMRALEFKNVMFTSRYTSPRVMTVIKPPRLHLPSLKSYGRLEGSD